MDNFSIRFQQLNEDEPAPYAQVCKVILGYPEETATYYIQLSHNEEKPNWVQFGEFLEYVFEEKITDEKFVQNCLDIYEEKVEKETAL